MTHTCDSSVGKVPLVVTGVFRYYFCFYMYSTLLQTADMYSFSPFFQKRQQIYEQGLLKFMKMANRMQLSRIIYCVLAALHVSSDIFAHHQEHLHCIYTFWCYSHVSLHTTHVNNARSCIYSSDTPDDGRQYRSKHVKQSRNNKLSYTVATCW